MNTDPKHLVKSEPKEPDACKKIWLRIRFSSNFYKKIILIIIILLTYKEVCFSMD